MRSADESSMRHKAECSAAANAGNEANQTRMSDEDDGRCVYCGFSHTSDESCVDRWEPSVDDDKTERMRSLLRWQAIRSQ